MPDTKVVSIRLSERNLSELQREATQKGISFNTLVVQILERYLNFYRISDLQGYHWVSHPVMRALLDGVTDDAIKKVTEMWIGEGDAHTKMTQAQKSVQTMIDANEKYLASMNMSFRAIKENSDTKFIINHDLGRNWPGIQVDICRDLYGKVGARLDEIDSDEKFLSYTIKED